MKAIRIFVLGQVLLASSVFVACSGGEGALLPDDLALLGSSNPDNGGNDGGNGEMKLTCHEASFAKLVNLYRLSKGLNTLVPSKAGAFAGRWHANDMIEKGYFAHNEPGGRTWSQRMNDFGYPGWSENIVSHRTNATDAFCAFKNSPGHDANMLGAGHKSIGIGMIGNYWSNGYGPVTADGISEPHSTEAGCVLPTQVPSC